jgi:hypothetical protein
MQNSWMGSANEWFPSAGTSLMCRVKRPIGAPHLGFQLPISLPPRLRPPPLQYAAFWHLRRHASTESSSSPIGSTNVVVQ